MPLCVQLAPACAAPARRNKKFTAAALHKHPPDRANMQVGGPKKIVVKTLKREYRC